jgi:hypothetical protein
VLTKFAAHGVSTAPVKQSAMQVLPRLLGVVYLSGRCTQPFR